MWLHVCMLYSASILYIVSEGTSRVQTNMQVNNFTKQVHLISVLYHIVVGAHVGGSSYH